MPKLLAPLIAVYALVAALVLVGAPRAEEQAQAPNSPSSGEQAQSGDAGVEAAQPTTTPNATPAPQPAPAPQAQDAAPAPQTETTPAPEAPVAVAAGPGSVSIVDFDFSPGTITVNVGDTVTWSNTGKQGHSATGSGFDTGILSKGQSGSHTFGSAGSFSYHCTPHPFMKGTVVVKASGSGGGSSGGGSPAGGSSAGGSGTAGGGSGSASTDSGSSASGSSGSALPATGADALLLAGFGLLLLGLGAVIRRRAANAQ